MENLVGSLLGVAIAWLFMTYAFKKLRSTKSLIMTSVFSFICVVGMPYFIRTLVASITVSIVYQPFIIMQVCFLFFIYLFLLLNYESIQNKKNKN